MENLERIKQLTDEISEKMFELSYFFDGIPVLCIIADKNGNFIRVNNEFTNYLGWAKEDFIDKPWLSFVHPDDIQKTIDVAEQMVNGEITNFTNRYITKDGEYKNVTWLSSKWINGKTYGIALKQ